jgi:phosphoenolpyruvate carboxylase
MDQLSFQALENFKTYVGLKYQLYNSLFTSLPFHRIEKTGILLSLFLNHCEESFNKKQSPLQIVDNFFANYTTIEKEHEKSDLLFRFVQYVERQVVLFDALEDAAFKEVHDLSGMGTLKQLETRVEQENLSAEMKKRLKNFAVAPVLTAHPTQFYPGTVLGIINDLAKALRDNNTTLINMYLQQLGKTPLFKKQKPTPYDEAISLIWYLENIFYKAVGKITTNLKNFYPLEENATPVVKMGFWPGGDRDGNPYVTADITLKVADALRSSIIKCYYLDVRKLKRRLTFKGIEPILAELESKLYNNIFIPGNRTNLTQKEILYSLNTIRMILVEQHNGLFLYMLDSLINNVETFGLHFASLDIRQDSSIHTMALEEIAGKEKLLPAAFAEMEDGEKEKILTTLKGKSNSNHYEGLIKDTIESFDVIKTIQQFNGEAGCNRYIISHCENVSHVLDVYALFLLTGWKKETISVDIVPLFETIEDLGNAPGIMNALYKNKDYKEHLMRRNKKQTIMVGFSDGTKDGGYMMANWSIYKAKEELTRVSEENGIDVVFFDGRGGPPARGGGKTHKYYATMGSNISTKEIHLTIQGQTVSSSFGTVDAAQFNIEQLVNAGMTNTLFSADTRNMRPQQEDAIKELAEISYEAYKNLKEHPAFIDYLTEVSPLNYFSDTNISSRPSKRKKSNRLSLKDLRAIPFVGAWSQLKQNVPGYYGLGIALEQLKKNGKFNDIKVLYQQSQYFKTLIDNCEMAMKKSFFPLTAYLSHHPKYGEIWNMIFEEYERTRLNIFKLSGKNELMYDYPVDQLSVQMRERIVLPLTTIQQYALIRLREEKQLAGTPKETLEHLVVRTSFGIINAGRNSV